MKQLLRKCILRVFFCLQLHRIMKFIHRKKTVILMYHGFTDREAEEGVENSLGLHCNIGEFRSQIEYLKKEYAVISLEALVDHYRNGAKIPDNAVVITFDDGYRSNYSLAYPVLKEYGIPATVFLVTDFIDKGKLLWIDRIAGALNAAVPGRFTLEINGESMSFDIHDSSSKKECYRTICSKLKTIPQESREDHIERLERSLGKTYAADNGAAALQAPLRWNEILEMQRSGLVSFGSHTRSHFILTRCSAKTMEEELSLSAKIIREKTGSPCTLFCYPNGEEGDFDKRTRASLQRLGYSCGVSSVAVMNGKDRSIWELKRWGINNGTDLIEFSMIVSGAVHLFSGIRQAAARFFIKHG